MAGTGTLVFPELLTRFLRPPLTYGTDAQGDFVATFEPPLSAAEQTVFSDIVLMANFGVSADITLAEFQAIKPNLADLRPGSALQTAIAAFRTRTDAQWNALTAAQRQADQIAWLRDLTDAVADLRAVLGALLRS